MLISLLVSVMSYQYGPDLVVVYANEAIYALLLGVLVNVIVNQNNTTYRQQEIYTTCIVLHSETTCLKWSLHD